jgi:NADPH:quinone reductase-like Zn-dependent oxidoreductase
MSGYILSTSSKSNSYLTSIKLSSIPGKRTHNSHTTKMSTAKAMNAITFVGKTASANTIPLPKLRPTHLLVKVEAVALNPTDWKHIAGGMGAEPFSIVGCDYAGEIVSIGSDVTKSFKVGEKVYGCAHGSNFSQPYDGVFAEYAMVKGDVAMRIPRNVGGTFAPEDVVSIPLGSITVGQGLFQQNKGLALALPEQGKGNGEWLLIYGGGTATGSLGIQFAKLAGYKVITTCSPRSNEFVKSRGADEVFNYNDPQCGAKIRELTGNKLKYAWDTISLADSAKLCDEALSSDSAGLHYGSILAVKFPREGVKHTTTMMYTMFGEEFEKKGNKFPASKDDYEFAKMWMRLLEKLVAEGKVKPYPKRLGSGGLEGVLKGLEEMKAGKVRGEKLVYRL